jgi:hypothetical protein
MSDTDDFTRIDALVPTAAAALAAAERGDPDAACAALLEADDFPAALRHLPRLPEAVRRDLARHCVDLYRAAGPGERGGRLLMVHRALLARRLDLVEADGFEAAMRAAMHLGPTADEEKRALCATALAFPDFPRMVDRLRPFEYEMRRRLFENVLRRMQDTAGTPEERERVAWMCAVLKERPLSVLDAAEVEPALLAAVEHGDVAAACAMAIADRAPHEVQDRLVELPEGVRTAGPSRCRRRRPLRCFSVLGRGRSKGEISSKNEILESERGVLPGLRSVRRCARGARRSAGAGRGGAAIGPPGPGRARGGRAGL